MNQTKSILYMIIKRASFNYNRAVCDDCPTQLIWKGFATTNWEFPKCSSLNHEFLKCATWFELVHIGKSQFVVADFRNSWFEAGLFKKLFWKLRFFGRFHDKGNRTQQGDLLVVMVTNWEPQGMIFRVGSRYQIGKIILQFFSENVRKKSPAM